MAGGQTGAPGCERRATGQSLPLRRALIRHERYPQRDCVTRWLFAFRRHFPDFLRLQPECAAHGGADARAIFLFTHASIGLGGDRPTHQAIEHLASLRLIPHLDVWRPADSVETAVAWTQAVARHAPSCLALSRQK